MTASFDRSESYTRVIDGQVRCITPEIKPQNLQVFFIFLAPVAFRRVALETPEWTSRASNHHRQSVSAGKTNAIPTEPSGRLPQNLQVIWNVQFITVSVPAWMILPVYHSLRRESIKTRVPQRNRCPVCPPHLVRRHRGALLAPDAWKCKRAQVSLKATIDVPMLGTIIEQNGDGLLEDSHMPVGWPLHIDGAVRQCCIHRSGTLQSSTTCWENTT